MSSLHHHQVDEVLLYSHQIDGLIGSLETCEYRPQTFRELLDQLQKMIDDLNLRSYANLSQWVSELDRQVCPQFWNVLYWSCEKVKAMFNFHGYGI